MSGTSLEKQWREAIPEAEGYLTSPTGFKQLIQSTLAFLQTHELLATLWVKLPKKDIWRADFAPYAQRYRPVGAAIYSLERGEPLWPPLPGWQPIPLTSDEDLKQEYLFLALAEGFACTFLAVRQSTTAQLSPTTKPQLKLYTSLSTAVPKALATTLQRYVQATGAGSPQQLVTAGASVGAAAGEKTVGAMVCSPVNHALSHWRLAQSQPSSPLIDAFLTWQMQFHAQFYSQLYYQSSQMALAQNKAVHQADFLRQSAQELRTPLTTVKTAITLLNQPDLGQEQRQRYLDLIGQACDRQTSLINGIFDLLHLPLSAPQPQALQLRQIVPSIVSAYQPLAQERSIVLACHLPADLPPVSGVEATLRQILVGLLDNAMAAIDGNGQVQVTADANVDSFVALRVEDTGRGIASSDLTRVFEAFYRGVESAGKIGGAGLGLTLAQKQLEQYGGSIHVNSTRHRGSLFTLLLPVHSAGAKPGQIATESSPAS